MNILRDLEDGKAFEQGLNNTTTARVLTRGLENPKDSTARSSPRSPASSIGRPSSRGAGEPD
jgi:hypothetical protein